MTDNLPKGEYAFYYEASLTASELNLPLSREHVVGYTVRNMNLAHRAVLKLFSSQQAHGVTRERKPSAILFRVERDMIRVRSILPFCLPDKIEVNQQTLIVPDVSQELDFRVVLNTITRATDEEAGGRIRESPVKAEDIADWAAAPTRLGRAFDNIVYTKIKHRSSIKKNGILCQQHDISGFGKIANPSEFVSMFLSGVGRAKAYGCGLLSVSSDAVVGNNARK